MADTGSNSLENRGKRTAKQFILLLTNPQGVSQKVPFERYQGSAKEKDQRDTRLKKKPRNQWQCPKPRLQPLHNIIIQLGADLWRSATKVDVKGVFKVII